MKQFSLYLTMMGCFFLSPMQGEEAQPAGQQTISVQDYDQQIANLKEQIARYKGLAAVYGRQAQLVEFRDFDGYRDATNLQNRCLAIAEDLTQHLALLEQERATAAKKQTPSTN